jgi:hypothetical protein
MSGQHISQWSAITLEKPDLDSPDLLDSCLGHASHARPTRTGADGNRSVHNPNIACDSGSYKLIYPILLAMKSNDPKTNLKPSKNLVADSSTIDLMSMNLVSPIVGINCQDLGQLFSMGVLTGVLING